MENKSGHSSKTQVKQDITSNVRNPKSHEDRLNDEEIEEWQIS